MRPKEGIEKRRRTRFSSWQIQRLEQVFLKTHYPDTKQIEVLALETNIPSPKMQVWFTNFVQLFSWLTDHHFWFQIWFQNRRAKWRKSTKLSNFGGLEKLRETEYVPAPNTDNISTQLSFDNLFYNCKTKLVSFNISFDIMY